MRFSTPQENVSKNCLLLRARSCRLSRSDEEGTAMKTFENIDAKSVKQAAALLQKFQQEKKSAIVVSGGSETLQLMKERVLTPDYVVNLKTITGLNTIKEERGGFRLRALPTLSDTDELHAAHAKP